MPDRSRAVAERNGASAVVATLREVVAALSPLVRRAGSPAEHEAAVWLAERLAEAGALARIEEEHFYDGYARQLIPLAVTGAGAGFAALRTRDRRKHALAAAAAAVAAAMIADDVSNGLRVWRRAVARRRTTWNVVAETGDPLAERVLIVLAHHDAAPTGVVFDQSLQRWLVARWPSLVEDVDTSLPLWWPIASAPALSALGAGLGSRRLTRAGLLACLAVIVLGIDIARERITPGANDNLSGVAALVALAERMRDRPPAGMRVLLVSCGAEEVLQGGVYGFAARHFRRLDRSRTWFLNLDTIGSPELIMVEGEGCFLMEDYPDPAFRDRVARVAAQLGVPLRRGLRSRSSSDAVLPSRAGYSTAMLASIDEFKCLSNYHLMSDTPENLSYETIAQAVELAHALAGDLAHAGETA